MLSGLLELYQVTKNTRYLTLADNIFGSLSSATYLTKDKAYHSILRFSTENYTDTTKGLIYADYYLLEAMVRYKKLISDTATQPNPSSPSSVTQINFKAFDNGIYVPQECHASMQIINMAGVVVCHEKQIHFSQGYNEIPFRSLIGKKGFYIIRIITDKGVILTDKISASW